MYSSTPKWHEMAGLLNDLSSKRRTLSETVKYLETAHPPVFASENGDMDGAYEARGRHVATIADLKKQLFEKDTAWENSQREKQRFQDKYEESLATIEAHEATIREKDETIELGQQDERDRIRKHREDDAQHKRELADLVRERDELLVSRDELLTKFDRYSRNNRELVQRNAELKRTIEQGADHKQKASTNAARKPTGIMRDFAPSAELLPQDPEEEVERLRLRNSALEQTVKEIRDENLLLLVKNSEWESERIRLENKSSNQEITIARLNDENENYEVMMRERTLNGDILHADFMQNSEAVVGGKALGSLAEELEAAGDEDDDDDDAESGSFVESDDRNNQLQAANKRLTQTIKDMTAEIKDLVATKKAQTQYINNLITRVLEYSDHHDILNVNPEETAKAAAAHKAKLNTQKDLPAPPSGRSSPDSDRRPAPTEGGISGYIMRSISNVRRSRPSSTVITPSPNQPPWEGLATQISPMPTPVLSNQTGSTYTAMSIPLQQGRGHRRTQSELSNDLPTLNAPTPAPAALVVNKMMYQPSPNGPSSPGSPGGTTNRTSYFSTPAMSRAISGISTDNNNKSLPTPRSVSTASAPPQAMEPPPQDWSRNPSGTYSASMTGTTAFDSLDGDEARSVMGPPRNAAGMTQYTSAVTTQKGMRPLRMVQDRNDMDAAKKKANRQSWFGGMFGGK